MTYKDNIRKEYSIKNKKTDDIKFLMDNENYEKAIELIIDFINAYPTDPFGKYFHAICLIKLGESKEGYEELEHLRQKRPKKLLRRIYFKLFNYYSLRAKYNELENLLICAKNDLEEWDNQILNIKYKYTRGLVYEAINMLNEMEPNSEQEKIDIFITRLDYATNDYFRKNRKQIEDKLSHYLRKRLVSKNTARNIYIRLYVACSNYNKAYEYIYKSTNTTSNLLTSYDICMYLKKYDEAKIYLDKLNAFNLNEVSKKAQIKILYINNKKEEAFILCKEYASLDLDILLLLYDYSIRLSRTKEAIEIFEKVVDSSISSRKYSIIIMELLNLYIYEKEYEKAYNLLKNKSEYLSVENKIEFYTCLSKNMDIPYSFSRSNSYKVNQLNNYDYNKALNHIALHKYENKNKVCHTVFSSDTEVEYMLEMIKPHLTKENLYEVGPVNKYEIDCTNLDINEERLIVGTIYDNNIIFCYPDKTSEIENDYISDCQSKVKKMSMIDKFNNRYSNFINK